MVWGVSREGNGVRFVVLFVLEVGRLVATPHTSHLSYFYDLFCCLFFYEVLVFTSHNYFDDGF